MAKVKQQNQKQSNKKTTCCCNSSIRSFIKFLSGKQKKYTIIQESEPTDLAMVKPIPINKPIENLKKKDIISSPKRETECKQYYFKGEVILVANDNVRFQEWLKLVEISK